MKYFRRVVGGLNYSSHTRPGIAHAVGVISWFMHSPSAHHPGADKRVICYILERLNLVFGILKNQSSD